MSGLVYFALSNYPKQLEWMDFFLPRLGWAQTLSWVGKTHKRWSWTNAKKIHISLVISGVLPIPDNLTFSLLDLQPTILMAVSANASLLFLETLSRPPKALREIHVALVPPQGGFVPSTLFISEASGCSPGGRPLLRPSENIS